MFGGDFTCGLDVIDHKQRLAVGCIEHKRPRAITHASSQIDNLMRAEPPQLVGSHLTQGSGPWVGTVAGSGDGGSHGRVSCSKVAKYAGNKAS
jgi:hypothetical protein